VREKTTGLDGLTALEPQPLNSLSAARRAALLSQGRGRLRELLEPVRRVLEDVHERGDAAALEYVARYDTLPERLRVPESEIQDALASADPDYIAALRQSATNIEAFHRAQLRDQGPVETQPGVRVWRVWRPIERIGVCTPGGALDPSCLLMSVIPARVAGCRELAVCTPPGLDGRVPALVLAAAALTGVTEVYALGAVQAMAAMAYGSKTLRRVDKIFGSGGSYMTVAKDLIASEVVVDSPAGPSKVLIIADETANPAGVAADLLTQAEHGLESPCVLVTTSLALAQAVRAELERQALSLTTVEIIRDSLRNNGAILVAASEEEALDFANAYAAERLEIMTRDPRASLERIQRAGSVFLGSWSGVAAGDCASDGNHILPAAGYAPGFGPPAIEAFGRWMQVQEVDECGMGALGSSEQTLAMVEGLPARAASACVYVENDSPFARDRKEERECWWGH
jgi:histidinol dehydrogenase